MKYYRMCYSTSKDIGRTFPQLHCLTQNYAHQLSSWKFPSFTPKLEFELNKTANLTEVLSNAAISANGFLINSKVKDILNLFNLMNHKYYDARIKIPKSGQTLNYYWLHLSQPLLTLQLDYDKSVFYETEWTFRKELIQLKSFDHYKELKSKDKEAKFGVKLDQIYVSRKYDKSLDLFSFLPFANDAFISKRLKERLENNNITGLQFMDAPEVKI